MNKVYRTAIWLWVLFLATFAVSGAMAVLKSQGKLQGVNPYFYLVGPISNFVGAAALITTSRGGKFSIAWGDPRKESLIQLIGATLNGLACWFIVMGSAFLVGLVTGPSILAWPRVIASASATICFIFGWQKVKKFKALGFIPLLVFLFHFFRNATRL